MTALATAMPKPHQNDVKIPNTSEQQSLLIQNRSVKKAPMTSTINKPASVNAAAPVNTHTEKTAAPNQPATNEIDLTAPQSVAYVAGRKFIMVRKMAKTQTSPNQINEKPITKSS